MKGVVSAVCVSEKKGVPKSRRESVTLIEDHGILGDAHAGKGIRQVSLLGVESIAKMEKYGLKGICYGRFAENITTQGLCLYEIPVGTRFTIGEAVLEVTQIGKKCHAEEGCEIARSGVPCIMPKEGIFARVIAGGVIKAGDPIEITG